MSEQLIQSQNERIRQLTEENASLKAENKDRRIKTRKGTEELDQLRAQLKTLTTERDTFKTKAESTPGEAAARIAELEGQLRTRDHRDAFAAVGEFEHKGQDGTAKKYKLADGVKPEAVWQLSGYKAEGETPDAKGVASHYAKALEGHRYLFAEATPDPADAGKRPVTIQGREAGPGPGKGTSSPTVDAARGASTPQTRKDYVPGKI